ncbi:MAG: cupin [Bacteroidota bacterium]|nr:cupin [Bacteroidota bacterium]
MAILNIPDKNISIKDPQQIREYLYDRGIWFDQWRAEESFAPDAGQDVIIKAYSHVLKPYMDANGYRVADVINVKADTPNLEMLRQKFLKEHIHTEDEVRFFVDGQGYFWFNLGEGNDVFNVLCQAGDLISVPANTSHWFDMGNPPFVKAIRIFIDQSGWVPHYTGSGIDDKYNTKAAQA